MNPQVPVDGKMADNQFLFPQPFVYDFTTKASCVGIHSSPALAKTDRTSLYECDRYRTSPPVPYERRETFLQSMSIRV